MSGSNLSSNLLDRYQDKNVFVRTVTYHYTGRLVQVDDHWLVLADAAWIAESDRWADSLATGNLREVEPYPGECLVARGAVVDICEWLHELPRIQK
jgi:small nuclear ribonucleoprotein (snRNP)-like protein